jgi:hypothetical protein
MGDALLAILRSISERKRDTPCEISEQTAPSRRSGDDIAPAPAAPVIAPVRWIDGFAGVGEIPFEMPCPKRRGLVERRGGAFLHFCVECGRWGAYGYGATGDRPGQWYCRLHRPGRIAR